MSTLLPQAGKIDAIARQGQSNDGLLPRRIWLDDEAGFSMAKVHAIRHNYQDHPLMQIDRLAQLAKSLMPQGQCRFIEPGTTQASAFNHKSKSSSGLGIEEIFHRIEEPGSWVALYNVETDPAYDQFLREALGSINDLIEKHEPGLFKVQGFIFVSAPPSVTPFHMDRENNFWLQIRGRKTMNVWEPTDRQTVAAHDVEDFIVNRNLAGVQLRDGLLERSHEFDTGPGDGVYFPSTSPHATRSSPDWVRPGNGVSVSIGIVFYTSVTRRHAYVHAINRFLRRIGLQPRSPGESPWLDRAKYPFGRAVVSLARVLRGYSSPTGF